jgi:hypothetical protein
VHPDHPYLCAFYFSSSADESLEPNDAASLNSLWRDCFGAEEPLYADIYLLHSPSDGAYESLTNDETTLVKEMLQATKRAPRTQQQRRGKNA